MNTKLYNAIQNKIKVNRNLLRYITKLFYNGLITNTEIILIYKKHYKNEQYGEQQLYHLISLLNVNNIKALDYIGNID